MSCRWSARHENAEKDRITPALCVNASGTDRLKLIVIHTAKRPRDFGSTWQPSELVDYFNNNKAWMNAGKYCTVPIAVQSLLHVPILRSVHCRCLNSGSD